MAATQGSPADPLRPRGGRLMAEEIVGNCPSCGSLLGMTLDDGAAACPGCKVLLKVKDGRIVRADRLPPAEEVVVARAEREGPGEAAVRVFSLNRDQDEALLMAWIAEHSGDRWMP